jgi:dTDP-4-dehydrorhamnose reductase
MRVLVLGAAGMLGHVVFRWFAGLPGLHTTGSLRSTSAPQTLLGAQTPMARLVTGVDALAPGSLEPLIEACRPDVVLNCIGLVKQLQAANDPLQAIPVNALLPHQLARMCRRRGARLVHISTDCVFSGHRGPYREDDPADATDLYGRSKLLGEVVEEGVLTLRTSIIGPQLQGHHGLLAWFLQQSGPVKGYARAVFSGLPSVEVARVLAEHVLPHPTLSGIYHLGSEAIDKHSLLRLIAAEYGLPTSIERDENVVIDRSLDASRLRAATGYAAPPWPELVRRMRAFG